MVYLKSFSLTSISQEEQFLNNFAHTCFDSYYPFMQFPNKRLESVEFDHITIFCGNNGSGKSSILNVIAEKLSLERNTPFNRSDFFEDYVDLCDYQLDRAIPKESKKQILSDLALCGISKDTLFCDNIDIVCESIVNKYKEKLQGNYSNRMEI